MENEIKTQFPKIEKKILRLDKVFQIDLPEKTEEALEEFLADKGLSYFLDEESKEHIRKQFKEKAKKCKQKQSK